MKTAASTKIVPGTFLFCSTRLKGKRFEDICYISHEEFRDFHDVKCLKNVKHLIDDFAGFLECYALNSETKCNENDVCYRSVTSFSNQTYLSKSGKVKVVSLMRGCIITAFQSTASSLRHFLK